MAKSPEAAAGVHGRKRRFRAFRFVLALLPAVFTGGAQAQDASPQHPLTVAEVSARESILNTANSESFKIASIIRSMFAKLRDTDGHQGQQLENDRQELRRGWRSWFTRLKEQYKAQLERIGCRKNGPEEQAIDQIFNIDNPPV
ncbi:MAG: hypothetical protein KGI73_01955 [Patescibacteria group bacterium]|nr:hypothetical protein [Patescibacteria group bacterium]